MKFLVDQNLSPTLADLLRTAGHDVVHTGDIDLATEGELVTLPPMECDRPDSCGCGRSFAGLTSHRATTTAEIVERSDLDQGRMRRLLEEDWERQGVPVDARLRTAIQEDVAAIEAGLAAFPLGGVVHRAGDGATLRWMPPRRSPRLDRAR